MTHLNIVPKNYDIFIGIDVDKSHYSFTVKDHDIMKRSKTIPAQAEHFYQYIRNHFPTQRVICAYEAGVRGSKGSSRKSLQSDSEAGFRHPERSNPGTLESYFSILYF